MENVLDNLDFDLTYLDSSLEKIKLSHFYSDKVFGGENEISINLENKKSLSTADETTDSNNEDSGKFLDNLLRGRQFFTNEVWNKINTIQARIVSFDEEKVYLDCLVDSQNKVFEHRGFPSYLFEHLNKIVEKKPILIKTKINPGSSRIDIYPGEGIVNTELFDLKDKWEMLRDSGLDEKLF